MCQEESFKFYLDTRNNAALPLDPACPEHLKVFDHQPVYPTVIYCFVENLSKGDTVFWDQNILSQILVFEKKKSCLKMTELLLFEEVCCHIYDYWLQF